MLLCECERRYTADTVYQLIKDYVVMSWAGERTRYQNARNQIFEVECIRGFATSNRHPIVFDRVITLVNGPGGWLRNSLGIVESMQGSNVAMVRLSNDSLYPFHFDYIVVVERVRPHPIGDESGEKWECASCTFANHCCAWSCEICEVPLLNAFTCCGLPLPSETV